MDIEHLPAPNHFVMVSGQLRPFIVKLVVTLVANVICAGEFSWLMGAILPHDLLWGHTGVGYMSQSHKPRGFSCCSITRVLTSTPVCLDTAILWVQSSPQPWTVLLTGACHCVRVLPVP